jgi:hypothetical protein
MTHIAILAAAAATALAVAVLFGGVTLMLRGRRASVVVRLQRWGGSPRAGGGLYDPEQNKHRAHGDRCTARG